MTITIREPVAEDADAIASLHVATWREAYAHLLPDDFFTDEYIAGRHRMWTHVLGDPRAEMTVRVAEQDDGSLVGFAWAGPSSAQASEPPVRERALYAIYVLARAYGSGVGQALLDATLGNGPAQLWVAKENPRATRFYERNGFAFDGTEQIDPHAPLITDARMVR
ncbi:N-acetyltransferase family protein [Microbacterium sp. bgisy203]|uniref:GNAT family N-acetyltransferase n=1 Tax=Microbacterium sp. bgisy203 TaxID=3413799 RepID=UPI003D71C96A